MKSKNRSSSRRRKRSKSRGRSPPCIRKAKKEVRCLALVGGRQCCRKVAIDCVDYCYQHAQKTNFYCSPIRNYRRTRSRSPIVYRRSPVAYRHSPIAYRRSPVVYRRSRSQVNSPVREASLEFIPLPNIDVLSRQRQRSEDQMKSVMVELKQKSGLLYQYLKKQGVLGVDLIDSVEAVREFPYNSNAIQKFFDGVPSLNQEQIEQLLENMFVVLGNEIYTSQFIPETKKFCSITNRGSQYDPFCKLAVNVINKGNQFFNILLYSLAGLVYVGGSLLVIQYLYFNGTDFKTIFSMIPTIAVQDALSKVLDTISGLPEIATAMVNYLFSFAPVELLRQLFAQQEISAFFENVAKGEQSAKSDWLAGGLPDKFKLIIDAARIKLNIGEYPSILPPVDIPYSPSVAMSTAMIVRPQNAIVVYNPVAQANSVVQANRQYNNITSPSDAMAMIVRPQNAVALNMPEYNPQYRSQVPYSSTPVTADGIMEKVISSPVILQLLKALGLGVSSLAVAYAIMGIYKYLSQPAQVQQASPSPAS